MKPLGNAECNLGSNWNRLVT